MTGSRRADTAGVRKALRHEIAVGSPRLRYSGASIAYQVASITAGGPAPLIATALFAAYKSGTPIAIYILATAVISTIATAFLKAIPARMSPPNTTTNTGTNVGVVIV